jgi:hypothetical protein
VAALFDKGEHFVGKSLPVSSDICLRGEDLNEEKCFLTREYSSERQQQGWDRATFHSMLLSLERVEMLILDMISRVDWNKSLTSIGIVPWPDGREVGMKSLT